MISKIASRLRSHYTVVQKIAFLLNNWSITPIILNFDKYIIYMKYKYISFNKLIFLHLQLFPTILLFHIYIVIMMIAVITNNFHGKEDPKCLTTADI